jgi:hypothetical protein
MTEDSMSEGEMIDFLLNLRFEQDCWEPLSSRCPDEDDDDDDYEEEE